MSRAAKAAGLCCIAVPHEITERLDLSHADLRLPSLADVTLRDVLALAGLTTSAGRRTSR